MRLIAASLVTASLIAASLIAGCEGDSGQDDPIDPLPTSYQLELSTDPAPPLTGQPAEVWYTIEDQDGAPIEDLQMNHERLVHVFLISADLSSFKHKHHEDFYPVTAETLRDAAYHLPESFPYSGRFRLAFDFAHANQYHLLTRWIDVAGDTPQLAEPVDDFATERDVGGVHAELVWDVPPIDGFEAEWTLHLTDAATGAGITDVVQWLGADAHAALVSRDLEFVNHTHAWFAGMEDMPPDHQMPHTYPGPDLPFHYVFPSIGTYKMWVQFARAADPETPVTVPFMFKVEP